MPPDIQSRISTVCFSPFDAAAAGLLSLTCDAASTPEVLRAGEFQWWRSASQQQLLPLARPAPLAVPAPSGTLALVLLTAGHGDLG
jgi:hypothetical protein